MIDVAVTVVVLSVTAAAMPSLTVKVKVVCSVLPTATWLAVGVKTSPLTAAWACAAVPVKL